MENIMGLFMLIMDLWIEFYRYIFKYVYKVYFFNIGKFILNWLFLEFIYYMDI